MAARSATRVTSPPAPLLSEADLRAAFSALANPTRLAIIGWLKDLDGWPPQDVPATEVGVCLKHIQARAGVSQSTASQYLAVLQRAGLVTSTRIGPWTHYRRDEERIGALGRAISHDL